MLTADSIKSHARTLGFDACGIAPAAAHPELAFFSEWLGRGYSGDMHYLARSADKRSDVRNILPSARTVIVTATVYNTDRPYSTESVARGRAQIARYAWGDDYHEVIGARLEALLRWMRETSPAPFEARAYVDTGPVQERVYAQHAGIGWIGKNTCVISESLGSWIFLAEIITSLELEVDPPAVDQCGTCTLCIEACPTSAIVGPSVLDATRCISYLTIEHRGEVPEDLERAIGSHVYGCDICQEVCPWNQMPPVSLDPSWQPRPAWDARTIDELQELPDETIRTALRGSPMKRTKLSGLRRNLSIADRNASQKVGP